MLEYQSKTLEYDNNQQPVRLRVFLGNVDGAFVPILLDPDKANLPNAEIYNLAMEKHYQVNFPNRAENEKFNLFGEKIAKYDELIEKSQNAIKDLEEATAEAKDATVKNEEAVNNAVSELTELIMGILVVGGIYTYDQVPKLFNLRDVVAEVLAEIEAGGKNGIKKNTI